MLTPGMPLHLDALEPGLGEQPPNDPNGHDPNSLRSGPRTRAFSNRIGGHRE